MDAEGYLIEKWIYTYAIRRNFDTLLKDHSEMFRKYSVSDMDVAIFTVRTIIKHDLFKQFDLLSSILESLQQSLQIFPDENVYDKTLFSIKFMHILQEIGNSSVEKITTLMTNYFCTHTSESGKHTLRFNDLRSDLIESNFRECRKFILNLLIKPERQHHFKNYKFPHSFAEVILDVKSTLTDLVAKLIDHMPPCELENYFNGKAPACNNDPSVLLFFEHFASNADLNEEGLSAFLKQLSSSQISVTPPQIWPDCTHKVDKSDQRLCSRFYESARSRRRYRSPFASSSRHSNNDKRNSDELFPTHCSSKCPPDAFFCNNGECFSSLDVIRCDGIPQCPDGSDESYCPARNRVTSDDQRYRQPEGLDVAVTIVFPTIFACILLVAAMLLGIKKCKQWELDRIVEMRRTRRLIQRMTQTLREKNFRTLQAAYTIRKRQKLLSSCSTQNYSGSCSRNGSDSSEDKLLQQQPQQSQPGPPPQYSSKPPFLAGTSPPPSYDDALFDTFYRQIFE